MSGRLVLIATPIGHLGDLSPRAADALRQADIICCEDTRRTSKLLTHTGTARPRMWVVNEHTEMAQLAGIVTAIEGGANVALVSDAGMPAISDPGERVVRAVLDAGLPVTVVPGPSAAIAAVAISGLPTSRFVMEGFIPRSGVDRRRRLADIATEPRTVVLYEAPHRLVRTLTDLAAAVGPDRPVVLVRELTKLHEETWRGSLAEALDRHIHVEPRGEYVLVLAGCPPKPIESGPEAVRTALRRHLSAGSSRKEAIAAVALELDLPKKLVYAAALELDDPS